jgi:hypothetical protein
MCRGGGGKDGAAWVAAATGLTIAERNCANNGLFCKAKLAAARLGKGVLFRQKTTFNPDKVTNQRSFKLGARGS